MFNRYARVISLAIWKFAFHVCFNVVNLIFLFTEERKKSNLSEGEEPEIHLPFKISPFDKDALKPVSGSDVFINPHVIDNNNTKSSEDNSAIIENLHEFEDKLIETWSSPKARRSSTSGETMETITKDAEEDRDEIFMIVKGNLSMKYRRT